MPNPRELTRDEIIRAARTLRWTRKMPKWTVTVESRELPARPLVLEAAGVPPNDPTNSHQAVAILERLGFETHYDREQGRPVHAGTPSGARTERVSVADMFSAIANDISESEWARIPADLSKNVDHYLYGSRKPDK